MRELTLAGRRIADDEPAYVIAEIGANHGGSFDVARDLVRVAAKGGASAVKFQRRANETLYATEVLQQPYLGEQSFGATYGEHRAALELSDQDYAGLMRVAAANQIALFATAFDEDSARDCVEAGMPAIKIASGGLTDVPLLKFVAQLDVPVILSTGGGTLDDIKRAVDVLLVHAVPHAILHCTAAYPLLPSEANLRCILTLRNEFPDTVIGWSSHHTGIALSLVAYALGARIIEQHVTLDRAGKGTDHAFSLEPKALATLVEDLEKTRQALGDGVKRMYLSERGPISKMRRIATPEGMRITR